MIVGNWWTPYALRYSNKFISPQWHCFPNKSPHFTASTHEVESTNLLSPMHGQFRSDQWAHTNFIYTKLSNLAIQTILPTKHGVSVNLRSLLFSMSE